MSPPDDRDRRQQPDDERGRLGQPEILRRIGGSAGDGSDLATGYRKAAPYMIASTQLVASVAGFTLFGWWLDRMLEHEVPWLLMAGAVVGAAGGFVSFFRTLAKLGKKP